MKRFLAALLLLAIAAPAALADDLRTGMMELVEREDGRWTVSLRQPQSAPGPAALVEPVLPPHCALSGELRQRAAPLALVADGELRCEGPLAGHAVGLAEILGDGDALLRVEPLGRPALSYRLTAREPVAIVAREPDRLQVWRSYSVLGVEHILAGWDHLLFVIALVLILRRGWPVAKAVTAFTVAHSVTLAVSTLGIWQVSGLWVEAVIALSIVFLALELARKRDGAPTLTRRFPWAIAFLFGLVHGFGFAGALAEIGMPEGEIPSALLAFNLGVEAGQLLVVGAVLLVLAAIARLRPPALAPLLRVSAYGIGITGSFWLFERLFA